MREEGDGATPETEGGKPGSTLDAFLEDEGLLKEGKARHQGVAYLLGKKTQTTPRREIETALRRAKEVR